MAVPSLVLGAVNLTDWAGVAYSTQVIAEGTSRGAPVPVEVAVKSWLQDGAVVVTQGYDNRTVNLRVKLRGPSLTALATAEAALFAELGRPNTLTWTPATGPASVFRVVTSSMEDSPGPSGDLAEQKASFPFRAYNIRLLCEAFVRSATEIVTAALAASGSTTTLVDNCSATTNWTGAVDGGAVTPSTSGGALSVTSTTTLVGPRTVTATRTASITTSSTKFLVVDWKIGAAGVFVYDPPGWGGAAGLAATGDGTVLEKVSEFASPTAGYTRSVFKVGAASTVTALVLSIVTDMYKATTRSLTIDNINRTDVRPVVGTVRQQMRTLAIGGSARTIGTVAIEHETAALGDVLLYTFPDDGTGYTPACRTYRVSGGTVSGDADAVSGSSENIETGATFDIPHSALPAGQYLAMIRARSTGASLPDLVTITWSAVPRIGSNQIGSPVTRTTAVSFGGVFRFYPLGMIQLPVIDMMPSATAVTRATVAAATSPTEDTLFDELYLLNLTIGRLTMVACGEGAGDAGGVSRRLWVESPSLANQGRGRLLRGHSADQSDAFSAWPEAISSMTHEFMPPAVKVFTVTTNPTTEASVSFRRYEAWHTHAAS